eukprot:s383_g23.t1
MRHVFIPDHQLSQHKPRKRASNAMQPARPGKGLLGLLHGEARRLLSSAAKTSRGPGGCEKCRRLLGVGRSASREKLRRAFLAAAWKHHPDGLGEGDFVELRRCYELLLENCGDSESGQDELPCSGTQEPEEPAQPKRASRRRPLQGGSARWASARAPGLAAQVAAPERLEVRVELALTASPLPPFLWATAAAAGHGPWRERPGFAFCGFYYRTIDYNAAPAFAHTQFRFYLFWSRFFSDWKIAGALSEKGACTAFFDGRRDDPPWGCAANGDPKPQQWAVWDADADSFAKRSVVVRPLQRGSRDCAPLAKKDQTRFWTESTEEPGDTDTIALSCTTHSLSVVVYREAGTDSPAATEQGSRCPGPPVSAPSRPKKRSHLRGQGQGALGAAALPLAAAIRQRRHRRLQQRVPWRLVRLAAPDLPWSEDGEEEQNPIKSAIAFISGVVSWLMGMLNDSQTSQSTTETRSEGEEGGASLVQQLGRTPIDAQKGLPIYSLGPFPRCTEASDLRSRARHVTVITTAALPWTTGPSINPLLRSLHLARSNFLNSATLLVMLGLRKMSASTVHWSPGEASLGLNSILGRIHNRLDVTEEMMKAATIGRSSELGPNWEPPGMVSRKIASILTEGGRRPDDDSAKSHREVAQYMKAIQEAAKKEPSRTTRLAEESASPERRQVVLSFAGVTAAGTEPLRATSVGIQATIGIIGT